MRMRRWLVCLTMCFAASDLRAEVTRIEVRSRADALRGQPQGSAGPYEIVEATIYFSVDPADPRNRAVVDLDKAPRTAEGRVEFSADLYVVKPRDPARGNGRLVFEVPNRGNHSTVEEWDYLMRRGFTIVALGWQYDVVSRPGRLRLQAPAATDAGAPIEGLVRYWFRTDERTPSVSLDEPARGTVPYPVLDPASRAHTLTVRLRELDEPRPIPRENWQFASVKDGKVVPDATSLYLSEGFEPGLLYEIVYRAQHPRIAGLGFVAVRDAISHFRYDQTLVGPIRHASAYGVSQSGRFLRGLIYEGFNTDVRGRAVFDGVFDLVAGGVRSGFNARFAQPSIVEPARFPFSDVEQRHPNTGAVDALLRRAAQSGAPPKIIHLNTSNEYWTEWKAAAMVHASVDGARDLEIPANVRVYTVVGAQHGPRAAFPPAPPSEPAQHLSNPNSYHWVLRGLVIALDRWVSEGVPPPSSRYPRLSDGSLVPFARLNFPTLPGVSPPREITGAFEVDSGPRWAQGIVDQLPPRRGAGYPVLVPRVDGDGNEPCCLRLPEHAVPLATYAGWNLRHPRVGAPTELARLQGAYIPFPRTKAERTRNGDPRASIEERYEGADDYVRRVSAVARALLREGYLLSDDVPAIAARAREHWAYATGSAPTRP